MYIDLNRRLLAPELLFPSRFILSDRGIRRAIKARRIRVRNLRDFQIQPASLDLRIGTTAVYDSEAMRKGQEEVNSLTFGEMMNHEPSDKFAKKYPDRENVRISVPSGALVEVMPHERVESIYPIRVELRSSRGRLGLEPYNMMQTPISLWNKNINELILYGRTPFAQALFFPQRKEESDGQLVVDKAEVRDIAKGLGLETHGSYVVFNLGAHAYEMKKVGTLDTRKKDSNGSAYKTLETKDLHLLLNQTIVAQLMPEISLPADIGINLVKRIPYAPTANLFHPDGSTRPDRSTNAGWVDPGYSGNLTAQLIRTNFPCVINQGEPVALGVLFKFNKPVARPYGHNALNSHYKGSRGAVARD